LGHVTDEFTQSKFIGDVAQPTNLRGHRHVMPCTL
jgi:hypothetical protein